MLVSIQDEVLFLNSWLDNCFCTFSFKNPKLFWKLLYYDGL